MRSGPTISQLVKLEFESIRAQLLNHGAQDGNPLTLQQDPPEPGAVYTLFYNDLRTPHIRVNVADKPNLLTLPGEEPREYPSPMLFDPICDESTFLGWTERGSTTSSISSTDLVDLILSLAKKDLGLG